jgi:hypothetical protein
MNILNWLILFLVMIFIAHPLFAQQGQSSKDDKENEPQTIVDYHFIFDVYYASRSLKSRNQTLDAIAEQLRADSHLMVYMVSSGGRVSYPGEAIERANALKKYLVERRGSEAERVEIINGGYCEAWNIYIWLGATGAPVKPTSHCGLDAREVKIIQKRRYNRMKLPVIKPAAGLSPQRIPLH